MIYKFRNTGNVLPSIIMFFGLISTIGNGEESLFRMTVTDPKMEHLQWIADQFEVVDRREATFDVLVPKNRWDEVRQKVPGAQINGMEREGIPYGYGYNNLSSVRKKMRDMAQLYPNFTKLEVYGQSSNHALEALVVTPQRSDQIERKRVMITAATHGDELITVEILLSFMERFLQSLDQGVASSSVEIIFVPVVSPESYEVGQRYVRGIDPNRSFPLPMQRYRQHTDGLALDDLLPQRFIETWKGYQHSRGPSGHGRRLQCVDNLIALAGKYKISGSLDLHAAGRFVMHPWGYTTHPIQDPDKRAKFESLTRSMASPSGYRYGQISRVIYVAKGSSADYFFDFLGAKAVAIEIGTEKAPSPREFPPIEKDIHPMIVRFLQSF